METIDLDPTDEEILALLNENARTPDEELAEQVGVSPAEVSERIERLQEEGVITRFTTMFDTSKLGYVSVAFGFSVEPGKADEIANLLSQYDNIWPYVRDIYTTPGIEQTVNMAHITEHYYTTHTDINPTAFVAVGPDLDFEADHDRDELPGGPPDELVAGAASAD